MLRFYFNSKAFKNSLRNSGEPLGVLPFPGGGGLPSKQWARHAARSKRLDGFANSGICLRINQERERRRTMSVVTGLALGLLVMVLGAAGLTVFALVLRKREQPVPQARFEARVVVSSALSVCEALTAVAAQAFSFPANCLRCRPRVLTVTLFAHLTPANEHSTMLGS